jgi:hypothetical protein
MRNRKQLNLSIESDTFSEFEKVAEASHLTPSAFAALIVGRFSGLKQEFGLHALTSIPTSLFKQRPGRPPNTEQKDPSFPSPA